VDVLWHLGGSPWTTVLRLSIGIKDLEVKGLDIDGWWYLGPVSPPLQPPIGLNLASAARIVRRAFDEALAEAGGSVPVWLVLLNLKIRRPANQRELAEAVGVKEATLTHHLNSMDAEGLITRQRDTTNRRIHVVELTDVGEETFLRLRTAAMAFDQRLRAGITEKEVASLEAVLDRLVRNVGADDEPRQWAGLLEANP
jgi:MarR family transcriptional regulator, transcriptional regulator for hemolysin